MNSFQIIDKYYSGLNKPFGSLLKLGIQRGKTPDIKKLVPKVTAKEEEDFNKSVEKIHKDLKK